MLSRREASGLAGALLVHALALGPVIWPARGTPPSPPASDSTPLDLDVDFEGSRATASLVLPTEATGAPESSGSSGLPTPRRTHLAPRDIPKGDGEVEAASPPGTPFSEFSITGGAERSLSGLALGLDGHNVFLGGFPDRPGSASPAPPEREVNVAPGIEQSLRDAARAQDLALGFGSGGPLVAVAEELVRPSEAPMDGRAVFEVTIDANGDVSGVRLSDASRGWDDGSRVAERMRTALRSRRLQVRAGKGVIVTLEVLSRRVLPSGARPGLSVSSGSLGGGFDVSDFGARQHREVHARVLGEKSL